MEIAARLTAYMAEPDFNKENSLFQRILDQEFSNKEAVAECKRKREDALYVYEVEKLRLYLSFERKLSRQTKEIFTVIDVKALTPIIKAELEAEEKKNQADEGEIK